MIHPLAREVTFWLVVKAVALAALFFLFFSPAHRPNLTPDSVEARLIAPASADISSGAFSPAHTGAPEDRIPDD